MYVGTYVLLALSLWRTLTHAPCDTDMDTRVGLLLRASWAAQGGDVCCDLDHLPSRPSLAQSTAEHQDIQLLPSPEKHNTLPRFVVLHSVSPESRVHGPEGHLL